MLGAAAHLRALRDFCSGRPGAFASPLAYEHRPQRGPEHHRAHQQSHLRVVHQRGGGSAAVTRAGQGRSAAGCAHAAPPAKAAGGTLFCHPHLPQLACRRLGQTRAMYVFGLLERSRLPCNSPASSHSGEAALQP